MLLALVGQGYARSRKPELAGWSTQDEGGTLGKLGGELLASSVGPKSLQVGAFADLRTALVDGNQIAFLTILGLPFQDHRAVAELHELLTALSARVRFLDSPGERALAAYAHPARGRGNRSGKNSRSEDDLVARAEGIAFRIHLLEKDLCREATTTDESPFLGKRLFLHCQIRHVHAQ